MMTICCESDGRISLQGRKSSRSISVLEGPGGDGISQHYLKDSHAPRTVPCVFLFPSVGRLCSMTFSPGILCQSQINRTRGTGWGFSGFMILWQKVCEALRLQEKGGHIKKKNYLFDCAGS